MVVVESIFESTVVVSGGLGRTQEEVEVSRSGRAFSRRLLGGLALEEAEAVALVVIFQG